MMFFLGLIVGGIFGIFAISALYVGKQADQMNELEKLRFRLYGRDKDDTK